jgi:hypothetical protein
LKNKPSRSDIFILGGGISGICAAIFAARDGKTVKLLDSLENLGGQIGEFYQCPMDFDNGFNNPFYRESGLFEEICTFLRSENTEGNYCGQARALFSLIKQEPNVSLTLGHHCTDITHSSSKDRIESCTILSHAQQLKYLHRSQYFIDCSISGELSKLANAPGDTNKCVNPDLVSNKEDFTRSAVLIEIETVQDNSTFKCPTWVESRWENNLPEAKLALLKSLEKQFCGFHLIEWCGQGAHYPTPDELCWSAWDFIKNRSPLKERASKLRIKRVIPQPSNKDLFRGTGDYELTKDDIFNGKEFYDSVAVSRAPIVEAKEQLNSKDRKIALPHFFEIPLRSLYSTKIKNLLWAGPHISCDEIVSDTLVHPPTLAQIGSAVGYCAAKAISENRLPRTIAKTGHIEQLQRDLYQKNHRIAKSLPLDENDLAVKGEFSGSTTWLNNGLYNLNKKAGKKTNACLLQFPITTERIESVRLMIHCAKKQNLNARLLQGSSENLSIPGSCLATDSCAVNQVGDQWIVFQFGLEVKISGWHFLELSSDDEFSIIEGENAPVGHLVQYPRGTPALEIENPYSEYCPSINYDAKSHCCGIIEISPPQTPYSANCLKEANSRPTHIPGLWISQPTDFSYPEFVELTWSSPVVISRLELFFDPTFGYQTSPYPIPAKVEIASSIIKDFRIYITLENGKSIMLKEVKGNVSAHTIHEIENQTIRSLEIEILATHGLNRAQIFRIAVYE